MRIGDGGKVTVFENAQSLAHKCGDEIIELVKKNNDLKKETVLGLATGSTPIPVYKYIREKFMEDLSIDFSTITTFNLDEYSSLPLQHPQSYYSFMFENLFTPEMIYSEKNKRGFRKENIHLPTADLSTVQCLSEEERKLVGVSLDQEFQLSEEEEKIILEKRAADYDQRVRDSHVDYQILGIGHNGHIGFCEPGSALTGRTSVVVLSEQTRIANARFFENDLSIVPKCAISMGIGTILESKRIALLATGEGKKEIICRLLKQKEAKEDLPASALLLHSCVHYMVDKESYPSK